MFELRECVYLHLSVLLKHCLCDCLCLCDFMCVHLCLHECVLLLVTACMCLFNLMLGETSKFPHTNHKKLSVSLHTLAPTNICDLSHSECWGLLTDLGHINSVTYVCHPLWFVCGHRKGILTSPLIVCTYIPAEQILQGLFTLGDKIKSDVNL